MCQVHVVALVAIARYDARVLLLLPMKHTPGPWNVDCDSVSYAQSQTDHTQPLLTVHSAKTNIVYVELSVLNHEGVGCNSSFDEEQKANARLIAAAPDLLDACKAARDALTDGNEVVWQKLVSAIAKAESSTLVA